ncbi:MAG: hypothetical protein ACM3UU_06180 [Ignavibacteriales bacterium]
MKHYDEKTWKSYINKSISHEDEIILEEHLIVCDECLEVYMDLLEKSKLHIAENIVPSGFTDKVMNQVSKSSNNAKKQRTISFSSIMTYYVAAACLTLFFTINGGFQYITNNATGAIDSVRGTSKIMGSALVNGWTDRLSKNTTGLLDKFQQK